jgi:hypothetical protein
MAEAEDREAVRRHVRHARERVYPALRVAGFPDAARLTAPSGIGKQDACQMLGRSLKR